MRGACEGCVLWVRGAVSWCELWVRGRGDGALRVRGDGALHVGAVLREVMVRDVGVECL